jgi:putative transposase
MAIPKKLLEELLKDYQGPEDIIGENGLLKQLTKALVEQALQAEMKQNLGYEKNDKAEKSTENRRNGSTSKTVRTEQGPMDIDVPRDRDSEFEPKIIPKHEREFKGFDGKILSMYARGMSNREIAEHLKEIYNTDVSPEFISRVTDSVLEYLDEWKNRELESVYPIVFLDAIFTKIRDNGHVVKKALYMALAINLEGKKELLGLWIDQNEGAKFWLGILNELKNRGVSDILIAAVDGLTGFPQAINAVFPKTVVQLCIVHMVRSSLKFVPYKDRKPVAVDLKKIYCASTEESALEALDNFSATWDGRYAMIAKSWRNRWTEIAPFFAFPPDIRKAIYTTNAIESLNYSIKKVMKNKLAFPNVESVMKLIFMALQNISKKWTMPIREWSQALNQFAIMFEGRLPL